MVAILPTPAHYAHEVSRESFATRFAGYTSVGATEMDANDRLYQLEAMIHHDVTHGGSMDEVAGVYMRMCWWWLQSRTTW